MSQRQTNLKKTEMDCNNCAFWKLISSTVFQSSFLFVTFEITLGSGRHDLLIVLFDMIHVKQNMFTRWPPSWNWAFQVSGLPQLLYVSFTIVYTCQDRVLESLKIAFFVVIFDSKYSKMTPEFVKQKSVCLHSSIKFANPAWNCDNLSFKSNYNVHMDSSSIVNKVQSVIGIINKKNY